MKNNKALSSEACLEEAFLSACQLDICRALFREQTSRLELVVVNLAALDLERGGETLARACLHQEEQRRLASFRLAKRRREWLGGRIAAKKAAMALFADTALEVRDLRDWQVAAEPSGRPCLLGPAGSELEPPGLSISHSGSYAGGLAVMGANCGLDLQQMTPQVAKVRDYFTTREEQTLIGASLPALDETAALSLLWSAKEAVRKAVDCQPLLGFLEISFQGVEGGAQDCMIGYAACPRLASGRLPVFLVIVGDYVCAISVAASCGPWS